MVCGLNFKTKQDRNITKTVLKSWKICIYLYFINAFKQDIIIHVMQVYYLATIHLATGNVHFTSNNSLLDQIRLHIYIKSICKICLYCCCYGSFAFRNGRKSHQRYVCDFSNLVVSSTLEKSQGS